MRYFLTGFMGCGKSYWAKKLSEQLHYQMFDLDHYIEENENCKIAELFLSKGEAYFRDKESFYLNEIISLHDKFIMGTGGGTPCFHDNILTMNEKGTTIYLEAEPNYILSNLNNETTKRPLLKDYSKEELLFFIEKKISERKHVYSLSKYIVDAKTCNETIFEKIIANNV